MDAHATVGVEQGLGKRAVHGGAQGKKMRTQGIAARWLVAPERLLKFFAAHDRG